MATLKIEQHDAIRLIALILRDDLKLQPAQANEIASTICTRIAVSMPDTRRSGFADGWRAIQSYPPRDAETELVATMRRFVPQADGRTLDRFWEIVFSYGREVPDAAIE